MNGGIKGKENPNKFFTVEFFGVTIIVTSFLLLVCLLFGQSVLFEVGKEIQAFILGGLGYFAYPFLLTLIAVGFMMLFGRKPSKRLSLVIITAVYLILVLSLLTVTSNLSEPATLNEYLAHAYESGRLGLDGVVAGGVLFSLITYPAVKNLTFLGAIILFVVLLLVTTVIVVKWSKRRAKTSKTKTVEKPIVAQPVQTAPPIQPFSQPYNQGYSQQPTGYQPYQQNPYNQPYGNPYAQPVQPTNQYPNQPIEPYQNGGFAQQPATYERSELYGNRSSGYSEPTFKDRELHDKNMQILYGERNSTYQSSYADSLSGGGLKVEKQNEPFKFNTNNGVSSPIKKTDVVSEYTLEEGFELKPQTLYGEDEFGGECESSAMSPKVEPEVELSTKSEDFEVENFDVDAEKTESSASDFLKDVLSKTPVEPKIEKPIETEIEDKDVPVVEEYAKKLIENMPIKYKYVKPPVSIFKTVDNSQNNYEFEVFKAEIKARILATLKTFGVDTDIPRVFRGPAVTRFDIAIPPDVPMSKVTKLQNDLNLRIAAKSAIRMIAPIPNTSYVGIEVPNEKPDSVSIKDIIVSDGFLNSKPFSLMFALGKDVIGNPVSLDLADMPHMLVTGTTGSGKSVCLNSLIISLITKYGPDELRFVIVDPKRVDLEPFKGIPHMMFEDIIEDVPTTNAMLGWAVEEMENRYRLLAKSRSKNIKDYNIKARENGERILPRIVIIMDEFADIMLQDKKGVATKVCLIAQKARAAGIHLVLAAQRPSVDIVEGPIKSNLPSRIVFRASSMPDSVVSLGEPGAEKLLGKGDCLYKTGGMLSVERVMGAYVSDDEMYDVIDFVTDKNEKYFDYNNWAKIKASVSASQPMNDDSPSSSGGDDGDISGEAVGGVDPVYIKAMRVGYNFGGLSVSFLQRKLAVGYPRAAKIVDWLTDNGYITPNSISGKRQMIMTKEDFEEKFGAE